MKIEIIKSADNDPVAEFFSSSSAPETDKFKIKFKTSCGEKYWVPVEHSERLERERDEAREDLKDIKKLHCEQADELLKLTFENRSLQQKNEMLKEMLDMQTKIVVGLEMRLMKYEQK